MYEVKRKASRSWGERVDALVGFFSPKWAAERAAWRGVQEFSYRNARRTRTDRGVTVGGAADYHLESAHDRREMVHRSRELERDNVIAAGLLQRATENVIGPGMRPQARTEDDGWNKRAEELFAEWAEACDVRGLDSFADLQAQVWHSHNRDGDVGTILTDDGKLQPIEADLIASPLGRRLDNTMVDGVELDVRGRPVAFHVVDETKAANSKIAPTRDGNPNRVVIPADSFLFLARRKRLGQTRGEPVLGQTAWMFDQLDGHIEAVVMAARMAACFGVLIEQQGGLGGVPGLSTTTDANGDTRKKLLLEPGMVKFLQPGEKVAQVAPQQPHQNFADFLAAFGRLLGLPLGLPLELVFLDFSRTNYSSARASLLQAYRAFRVQQGKFIRCWLRPIWRWKVAEWMDAGLLPKRDDAFEHEWIAPGWAWIDPKVEVEGNLAAIDAGFKTVADVVTEQGRDFEELVQAREREMKRLEKAGIPILRSNVTRDPTPEGGDATGVAAAPGASK